MATNGNKKGSRGEREFCQHLKDAGMGGWRRSQQYQGVNLEATGDIVPDEDDSEYDEAALLAEFCRFEVKRYKDNVKTYSMQMMRWAEQAREETPEGKLAVIAFRANHAKWDLIFAVRARRTGGTDRLIPMRIRATGTNFIALNHFLTASSGAFVSGGVFSLPDPADVRGKEKPAQGRSESGGVQLPSDLIYEAADELTRIGEAEGDSSAEDAGGLARHLGHLLRGEGR